MAAATNAGGVAEWSQQGQVVAKADHFALQLIRPLSRNTGQRPNRCREASHRDRRALRTRDRTA